jgi:hypothetical protein
MKTSLFVRWVDAPLVVPELILSGTIGVIRWISDLSGVFKRGIGLPERASGGAAEDASILPYLLW